MATMRLRRRRQRQEPGSSTRVGRHPAGFDLDADALLDEMTDDLSTTATPRGAAPDDAAGAAGPQRRAADGPARHAAAAARAPARDARALRPRRRVRGHRRAAAARSSTRSARASSSASTTPAQSATSASQEIVEDVAEQRRRRARPAPARPRGQGAGAPGVRVDGRRRAPAVRGAHGRAARAAHAELLQPDVRGHAEPRRPSAWRG